jgi:general secretion pathway protein L
MHRIVGLDLGGDAVRLVALESGFRGFSVQQMAQAAMPHDGTLAERLRLALPQLAEGGPLSGDSIAVSLPGAQIASFPITLPFTDLRRIEQVLPAEVEGAIPFDLDDVVWDYSILSQGNGKSELLVAVVRKQALKDALDALSAAGVDPKVVTFGPLALAALGEKNLLAHSAEGVDRTDPAVDIAAVARGESQANGEAIDAILEAGPDRADFCVLRDGKAELARSLPTAGRALWDQASVDPQALQKVLSPLIRDLKLTLRARAGKKVPAPQRILLAGALAHLPGAQERLSAELGLRCEPLHLSAATPMPLHQGEFDPAAHAHALGLALRAQNPRGRLNFRKGEFAFTKDTSQLRGHFARLGIALGAVLLLALFLGIARVAALDHQVKAYDDTLCAVTQRILKKCYTDWREALGALRGGGSRAAGIPRVGANEILAEVVEHLPKDPAPTIEDAEVTTSRVTLKGTVNDFGEASKVRDALQKDRCFGDIKPPRSERTRDGKVSFVIDFPYTCAEAPGGQ